MTGYIYHLAKPDDWARSTDHYIPPSVDGEGFIHCSIVEQLPMVAHDRFGDDNDLILLTIDPDRLDDQTLVYEDLYDLGWEFPHVYGPLPTSSVVNTGPYLTHLEDGLWMTEKRFDRMWMEKILHPDFAEVGMSGRTYDRTETIDARRPSQAYENTLPHENYSLELVDEDVAMVRYISRPKYGGVERPSHRSSIWVDTNEGWRLRFHQGTPLP